MVDHFGDIVIGDAHLKTSAGEKLAQKPRALAESVFSTLKRRLVRAVLDFDAHSAGVTNIAKNGKELAPVNFA
jgi:hypothetical protein